MTARDLRQLQVRPAVASDVGRLAELHIAGIPEGFLSTLGPRFLRRLYGRLSRSGNGFVLVAERAGPVTGFVAVSTATGAFYKEFLRRDAVAAALVAAPAVVRAPGKVWETLRYGTADGSDLPAAEVLSIAVDRTQRRTGSGSALLAAAVAELRRRGVDAAHVVTASTNEPAIAMYEAAGFRRHTTTEVHAGVRQEVLLWRSP